VHQLVRQHGDVPCLPGGHEDVPPQRDGAPAREEQHDGAQRISALPSHPHPQLVHVTVDLSERRALSFGEERERH
jgi:hypothetical protein